MPGRPVRPLTKLVAGSCVKGNLDTWIGHPHKNRAWDFLVEARRHVDAALAAGRLDARQRECLKLQLAVCEGPDGFWWPGNDNSAANVSRIEHLYQMQLTGRYRLMEEVPPDYHLAQSFSHGNRLTTPAGSPFRTGARAAHAWDTDARPGAPARWFRASVRADRACLFPRMTWA